jgi:hypothetical protein
VSRTVRPKGPDGPRLVCFSKKLLLSGIIYCIPDSRFRIVVDEPLAPVEHIIYCKLVSLIICVGQFNHQNHLRKGLSLFPFQFLINRCSVSGLCFGDRHSALWNSGFIGCTKGAPYGCSPRASSGLLKIIHSKVFISSLFRNHFYLQLML